MHNKLKKRFVGSPSQVSNISYWTTLIGVSLGAGGIIALFISSLSEQTKVVRLWDWVAVLCFVIGIDLTLSGLLVHSVSNLKLEKQNYPRVVWVLSILATFLIFLIFVSLGNPRLVFGLWVVFVGLTVMLVHMIIQMFRFEIRRFFGLSDGDRSEWLSLASFLVAVMALAISALSLLVKE